MRPTRRTVPLLAIGLVVALATLPHRPSRAGAAPLPATRPAAGAAELRAQRLATLRQAVAFANRAYSAGVGSGDDVSRYGRMLVDAELEYAASAPERVKILTAAIDAAARQEEDADARVRAAVATPLAPLEAKAYRLQLEIKRAELQN